MKSKAIIFDIDGTAIDSPTQKLPSQRLIDAIRAVEKDYYVCAATGRVWPFVEHIIKALKLTDPCIISGGTQIINPANEEILWQASMDENDSEAALKVMQRYPDFMVIYNEYTEEDYLHGGTPPNQVKLKHPVYLLEQKFIPKDTGPDIIEELSRIAGVSATLVTAQKPAMVDIHVTAKGATKEYTIARLLNLIKVEKENTIGFGDGHNDVHLFKAVGRKVAVDNAEDHLKAMADEVIGHVADDSFAEYLEKLARK